MSDLGWRADGINRALACGGVLLERYQRPGFQGEASVRRAEPGMACGFETWDDGPWVDEDPPDTTPRAKRRH